MKACVICQVQNSHGYIPAFLAHHLKSVDHVYLIDHNSDHDLRHLSAEQITVYRADFFPHEPDIPINSVLLYEKVTERYDWVFVLDIDEFLPFTSKTDLKIFAYEYQNSSCVTFQWLNGIPTPSASIMTALGADLKVDFQPTTHPTRKLSYNCRKNPYFWVNRANHNGFFPLWKGSRFRSPVHKRKYHKPLYHIPFMTLDFLREKFIQRENRHFSNKIQRFTQHLDEKYGEGWAEHDLELDDLYWLVANYRVEKKTDLMPITAAEFNTRIMFAGLASAIQEFRNQLRNCPPQQKALQNDQDLQIIENIRAAHPRRHDACLKHTEVSEDHILRLKS